MLVPSGYGYPPDTVLKNASNWSGVPLSSKSSSASNCPESVNHVSRFSYKTSVSPSAVNGRLVIGI